MKENIALTLMLSFTILLVSCGEGNNDTQQNQSTKSIQSADVGTVHTVEMIGDSKGFRYEPVNLTISPGDKVVWKMVSGAPHNVSFRGESTPERAKEVLRKNGKMASEYYTVAGQTFEIHFTEDYPTGRYDYVCEPHVASGMTGTLTIQPKDSSGSKN